MHACTCRLTDRTRQRLERTRTACLQPARCPSSLANQANHRHPAQATAMTRDQIFLSPRSSDALTLRPHHRSGCPLFRRSWKSGRRMLHPCPGIAFLHTLPWLTTEAASTSQKRSAHTNYPADRPFPPSPQSTPANPLLGTPCDHQSMIHLRPLQDRVHTFPAMIMNVPSPRLVSILHGPDPLVQTPRTFASLALSLKTPTHTFPNPNQELDSSPGTVPSITSNMTRKGTQPVPFPGPSTVRLGRGLQPPQ